MTRGTDTDEPSVIGEEAHIIAEAQGGPRHEDLPGYDYDCYENLMLLCRNHHKPVDDQFRHYAVEELRRMKREHETWVENQIITEDDPIRLVADPAYPIPKILKLCMTGSQFWSVMEGAKAFYPSWPDNLSEEQNDLIASFLDNVRDWMDVASMEDSYRVGRDAGKHLNELIGELNETGLFVGALRRHCLLTGGIGDPSPWLVVDIELQPIRDAEIVNEDGRKAGPSEAASED